MVAMPAGATGTLDAWTGAHEWRWTAAFEAFDAFPKRAVNMGQVPVGTYRFVVDGRHPLGRRRSSVPAHLRALPGHPLDRLTAGDARAESDGSISFTATATLPAQLRIAVPLRPRRRQRGALHDLQLPAVGIGRGRHLRRRLRGRATRHAPGAGGAIG